MSRHPSDVRAHVCARWAYFRPLIFSVVRHARPRVSSCGSFVRHSTCFQARFRSPCFNTARARLWRIPRLVLRLKSLAGGTISALLLPTCELPQGAACSPVAQAGRNRALAIGKGGSRLNPHPTKPRRQQVRELLGPRHLRHIHPGRLRERTFGWMGSIPP